MVSSKQTAGRKLNVFPPIHIVIARKSQLVFEISEAYENIMNKYKNVVPSMISIITGPSRTADIEKTLILGAHGPKEFIVFLLN
jgi:L-lactate dehydrogenase complex protein LldG